MSAHDDLLAAVAAAPDDDGPRLVMADWFEEHGDPDRAEFIRLQLALAKKDEYDPVFATLTAKENDLLRENGHRWKIPELRGRQELRRGFVEFVWLPGDKLLKQADLVSAGAHGDGFESERGGRPVERPRPTALPIPHS